MNSAQAGDIEPKEGVDSISMLLASSYVGSKNMLDKWVIAGIWGIFVCLIVIGAVMVSELSHFKRDRALWSELEGLKKDRATIDAALKDIATLSRRLVHIHTARNDSLVRIETHMESQLASARQHNSDMSNLMVHLKDVSNKSGERVRLLADGNHLSNQLLVLLTKATAGRETTNDLLRQLLSDSRLFYFNQRDLTLIQREDKTDLLQN